MCGNIPVRKILVHGEIGSDLMDQIDLSIKVNLGFAQGISLLADSFRLIQVQEVMLTADRYGDNRYEDDKKISTEMFQIFFCNILVQ